MAHGLQGAHHVRPGLGLGDRLAGGVADRLGHLAHLGLDGSGQGLHVLGALLGGLGQGADLFGDHREAAAVIPGPGGLDGGVEGQEVGLVGDAADGPADLADILGALLQLGDDQDRGLLPRGVAVDGADGGGDLHAGLGQHQLDGLGATAGPVGLAPGRAQVRHHALDRGQLLLRGAGRLLGAPGDLQHRLAQLLRGGGCLDQAAGQLFGRGGDPFSRLVLACSGPGRRAARARRRRRLGRGGGLGGGGLGFGGRRDLGGFDQGHGLLFGR